MATMRVVTLMAAADCGSDSKQDGCGWDDAEELSLYRYTTENLVRRYFQASVELGRLPAPLGKGLGFFACKIKCLQAFKLRGHNDFRVRCGAVHQAAGRVRAGANAANYHAKLHH